MNDSSLKLNAEIVNGVTKARKIIKLEEAEGTALVFIARGGQEGTDVKFDAYADGMPHYLALTEAE